MINRIPQGREYVTFLCKSDEILVPRSLVEKSRKLAQMLSQSHDNTLRIDKIAHDTLDDVILLLKQEEPIHTDPESIKELLNAIRELGFGELEKKMQSIVSRTLQPPS